MGGRGPWSAAYTLCASDALFKVKWEDDNSANFMG